MVRRNVLLATMATLLFVACPAKASASNLYLSNGQQPDIPQKTVVLTFDDGPSPYTPRILAILKAEQVPATFFVIGNQAIRYPDELKTMYDQGDEIGNHTFTHPDLQTLPSWRIREELNLTELLVIHQTGHNTRLMRPPYLGSDVLSASSKTLVHRLVGQGYLVAGEDTDTSDWRKPGKTKIIQAALAGNGGVLLMHDGGGDRGQTVQALPTIIREYKAQGYHFVTVGQALGLSRDQIMPPATPPSRYLAWLGAAVFTTWSLINTASRWALMVLIIASFGRLSLVLLAAPLQSRRKIRTGYMDSAAVSIIVPAYNEEKVIAACLHSILKSRYPVFEVIVVDDGSTDSTFTVASRIPNERLRVVRKINGGKASALNYGIKLARHELVVAIDADTVFNAYTLSFLLRHFVHPKVGAVSGNTRIVNRHRLITKLQSLEYTIGFNLDRRMGDLFDCITVVPGAIGAFRKSALQKIGGFAPDTLAEDTDLTLAVKELGYRIVYEASAVAYTEAPGTVKELLKQRFRWTFGTMQAVWKHRRSFLNPRQGTLGLIGLPYLVFYQLLFPLISPLFDVALVVGLLSHRYQLMLVYLLVYTASDAVSSGVALWLDREPLRQLWLLIPQRLFYRQLMYYVIVKSTYYVLRGRLVGWGKLKREGSHLAKAS